jgi:predicted 2-oxoglutarate/Fe(II)-dependent dioxygenase YbiX/peroxiredoxin
MQSLEGLQMLCLGDPAPVFECASTINPRFAFDTTAGRYIVLSFFGSSQHPSSEAFLQEIARHADRFDVERAVFFGVTNDPTDVQRIRQVDAGRIYFHDLDLAVSRKFGVAEAADRAPGEVGSKTRLIRQTFVLDPALRVIGIIGMGDDDAPRQVQRIFELLDAMPPVNTLAEPAPVTIVPYVFEPDFCSRLIDYYHSHDVVDSGFMRDVGGKTVGIVDYSHKRRMDCEMDDRELIAEAQDRIKRRLVPAIAQAYQFNVTRIERHVVACYDAAQGAHFRAHRDNTTLGTAHRRFAVTINLNSPEYDGGEIWFPEFGRQRYKPPTGAAIVFSCSLLHEVPKVTRGKRYAFLPFLYDDAAAAIRERNRQYLANANRASQTVAHGCATPPSETAAMFAQKKVIDGSPGCGNPEGCETCLTSPTYPLTTPADRGKS